MNITILAVGKIKEDYLKKGIAEYEKRLKAYAKVNITEVQDEKMPETLSAAELNKLKEREGLSLLEKIKKEDFVIALDQRGKEFTSEEFAGYLKDLMISGKSSITFIIGGSAGLSDQVLKRADLILSFGRFTYPHQLMRLILIEQIYRAFKIIRGETYHK